MLSGKVLFCVILLADAKYCRTNKTNEERDENEIKEKPAKSVSDPPKIGFRSHFDIYHLYTTTWHEAQTASLPFLRLQQIEEDNEILEDVDARLPVEVIRARVREGVPPPLCAGRCASPPRGPVCAFDAAGTARTFATLCELEAVSCRESTYYAITSLGEC